MTVMQAVVEWARQTLNLEPPHMDSIPDDPIEEVERSIARGRRVNQLLINELHHHEKADVAQALLRSRDRATLP